MPCKSKLKTKARLGDKNEQWSAQYSQWNFKSKEFQKLNLKMEKKISFEKATLILLISQKPKAIKNPHERYKTD